MNKSMFAAAVAAVSLFATPAMATTTVDFTATNFSAIGSATVPPYGTLSGTFSYDYSGGNSLTLTAFSLDLGPAHFGLPNVGSSFDLGIGELDIGGLVNGGINNLLGTTNDFQLQLTGFNPLTGSSSSGDMFYTTANTNALFFGSSATASPAVPEPATWAMMLMGFGGIGFALRRQKGKQRLIAQLA
jgi:hypothetical protein